MYGFPFYVNGGFRFLKVILNIWKDLVSSPTYVVE